MVLDEHDAIEKGVQRYFHTDGNNICIPLYGGNHTGREFSVQSERRRVRFGCISRRHTGTDTGNFGFERTDSIVKFDEIITVGCGEYPESTVLDRYIFHSDGDNIRHGNC